MIKNTFVELGYQALPGFFPTSDCRRLLDAAMATRRIEDLFLSEEEFEREQRFKGVNPRPGRNLIEKMDTNFIFSSPGFCAEMEKACGPRWRVLDYKFVMGVPNRYTPDWLNRRLKDTLVANLGPYVKEEYRDITYFRGIDFHQDIIDFSDRPSDFITVYLYLDSVGANSAPLHLLTRSHLLGASVFPHRLQPIGDSVYLYQNDFGDEETSELVRLTGDGGSLYYWHCNTLHGTQPQVDDQPRLSVRILVERNGNLAPGSLIDEANRLSKGRLVLSETRKDLDVAGRAVLRGNEINKVNA